MKTHQQIFDQVLTHLRKQGYKSFIDPTSKTGKVGCAYRDGKGGSCAIGCLIPDELYMPTFEGMGVTLVEDGSPGSRRRMFQDALEESGLPTDMVSSNLLTCLQVAHDDFMPSRDCTASERYMQAWEEQMQDIARQYKLVYTPCPA